MAKYTNPNSFPVMVSGSIIAGIVCSVMSLPADNIKTKLMKMKADKNGVMPYKGFFDCLSKSIKREGVLGLWVGCGVYITRITPHSFIVN